MTRFLLAASAAGLMGIVPAMAQTTSTQTTTTQATQGAAHVNSQDRTFVQMAAQGNAAEIQAGQLAQTRASAPAVREFGRWMVTDHTMLNQMLHAVAQREGVEVTTAPNPQQSQQASELEKLQGTQFDQAYMKAQVQGHEQVVALFKQQANNGQNLMLKRLAETSLPTIEQHLIEARELQQASGGSSVASTQPR